MPWFSRTTALASGVRDKHVTIQQTPEPSGGGFPRETWTELMDVWMSRHDMRADERFTASQESAFAETQWTMPYHEDMDPEVIDVAKTRRLVYRGRIYNIRGASLLDQRMGIELITLAKASA